MLSYPGLEATARRRRRRRPRRSRRTASVRRWPCRRRRPPPPPSPRRGSASCRRACRRLRSRPAPITQSTNQPTANANHLPGPPTHNLCAVALVFEHTTKDQLTFSPYRNSCQIVFIRYQWSINRIFKNGPSFFLFFTQVLYEIRVHRTCSIEEARTRRWPAHSYSS